MGVSSNSNAMETDQPPNNNNKKYYIDTNSVYVARENTEIASFVKDSMSKLSIFFYILKIILLYTIQIM